MAHVTTTTGPEYQNIKRSNQPPKKPFKPGNLLVPLLFGGVLILLLLIKKGCL